MNIVYCLMIICIIAFAVESHFLTTEDKTYRQLLKEETGMKITKNNIKFISCIRNDYFNKYKDKRSVCEKRTELKLKIDKMLNFELSSFLAIIISVIMSAFISFYSISINNCWNAISEKNNKLKTIEQYIETMEKSKLTQDESKKLDEKIKDREKLKQKLNEDMTNFRKYAYRDNLLIELTKFIIFIIIAFMILRFKFYKEHIFKKSFYNMCINVLKEVELNIEEKNIKKNNFKRFYKRMI
ncbi:hypothetical protein [Clostridium sp. L74]|uniref:hypothetical protein n=1 Tax=Clostridium sp. L74 TaxID=1560217 RepID=UPI0006AB8520|nr:hypothetical protein [Clostridium sp. L74]KOR24178.1 hypothetical protein ND00_28840 [Clostridium sp. L74]